MVCFTTVPFEILTFHSRSSLGDILTVTIPEQQRVKLGNFEEELLRSRASITQNFDALATVVPEILSHKLRLNLAVFLTLSMSTLLVVQTTNFEEMLPSSSRSIRQNLDVLATLLFEILTFHSRSFLGDIVTLAISEQQRVKSRNIEEELLRSRATITQTFCALATVVPEILSHELRLNLAIS